jgi:hypothetical protein
MYAQDQLFHKYGPKVFTDNQMSRIKYIYYRNNVSKTKVTLTRNGTVEDFITPQDQQSGQRKSRACRRRIPIHLLLLSNKFE